MAATQVESPLGTVANWMYFLGVLLILMGAYGFIRIAHVKLRNVPYPSSGVLPSTFLIPDNSFSSYGRESDCNPYPTLYYEEDNKTLRNQTGEERELEEKTTKRCIDGFNEDRSKQEQRDKNESAFMVFVGLGLVFARKLAVNI